MVDGAGLVLAPGFIDAHNHSTDGLLKERDGDHPGVAGHHHAGRGPGRQLAVADRRLPRAAARRPAGGQRRGAGRARHHPHAGDGAGLQAAGPAGRGGADAGAGRPGDGRGRLRPVVGPRVRGRHLLGHRRGGRDGPRGRRRAAAIYISHIRDEADLSMDAIREAIADRRAGEAAGADHAHQARHGRGVGQGQRGRGAGRGGAEARRRRHRRRVSLSGLAVDAEGAGARTRNTTTRPA